AYSQVMDTKGGKMVSRDFSPHGRAAQALKDVRLMLAQAARAGQELPGCEVAAALLESCVRHGDGDRDSTVIVEDIRRRVAPAAAPGGGGRGRGGSVRSRGPSGGPGWGGRGDRSGGEGQAPRAPFGEGEIRGPRRYGAVPAKPRLGFSAPPRRRTRRSAGAR